MNVLVTGGAGFIGRHLTKALLARGLDVCVLDDFSASGGEDDAVNLPGLLRIYRGSVADSAMLDNILSRTKTTHIFHLATRNITVSERDPAKAFAVNAGGTALVLQLAAKYGVQHVVYTSTCSVYGAQMPASELQSPAPKSVYSIAKHAGEQCCSAAPVLSTVLRLSNVYGPGQTDVCNPYCGVIGHFMRAALSDKHAIVYGDGSATRDYTFVEDVISAMLDVLDRPKAGIFNISTGIETSTLQLLGEVSVAADKNIKVEQRPERSIDIPRRVVDSQKFRSEFGWSPSVSLASGLSQTWDWWNR